MEDKKERGIRSFYHKQNIVEAIKNKRLQWTGQGTFRETKIYYSVQQVLKNNLSGNRLTGTWKTEHNVGGYSQELCGKSRRKINWKA